MEIIFKKGNTGNSLTCNRPDGTATWMKADSFMIIHDLTHYAVETVLTMKSGFYGLLAGGLDITDFEKKQKIKPAEIPAEGIRAELLVGLLLTEKHDQRELDDFNGQYQTLLEKFRLDSNVLSPAVLQQIRDETTGLIKKWNELPVGSGLVFNFPL